MTCSYPLCSAGKEEQRVKESDYNIRARRNRDMRLRGKRVCFLSEIALLA